MRAMIKYRGGKSREIPLFSKYIPLDYDNYIEPFFGGGAVYFHLEPKKAIINDINERLVSFYLDVRDNYDLMRLQLDEIQGIYENNQNQYKSLKQENPHERVENKNEAYYYWMRDMYNGKVRSKYLDGVLYYFINKTAYSGMIRYNAKGEYNVPFGRYTNLNTQIVTRDHSQLLQNACIYNLDYSEIFSMAGDNDFMFLDPPYDCIFNDYGNLAMEGGFGEEHHRKLAEDFRNLNCRALMVIGKTPLTDELYGDLIRNKYSKNYAVNIRNRFKTDAEHVVVTNY